MFTSDLLLMIDSQYSHQSENADDFAVLTRRYATVIFWDEIYDYLQFWCYPKDEELDDISIDYIYQNNLYI